MATNLLNDRRHRENPWEGYVHARTYTDGHGNPFPDHGARYTCFDGQELVGEFQTLSQASLAFLRGDRVPNGVRLRDYKGIPKAVR